MDYTIEELEELIERTTNPTHKEIYGNHLKRLRGKKASCEPCEKEVYVELPKKKIPVIKVTNPVNQDDEE